MENRIRTIEHGPAAFFLATDLAAETYVLPAFSGRNALTRSWGASGTAVIHAAMAAGADLNRTDLHGHTPLLAAAARGDVALSECLISCGADVNKAGICGRTPLMAAAVGGHIEVARLLLAHRVDPYALDNDGYSAFDYAAECPSGSASTHLCNTIPVRPDPRPESRPPSLADAYATTRNLGSLSWIGSATARLFASLSISYIGATVIALVAMQLASIPITRAHVVVGIVLSTCMAIFLSQRHVIRIVNADLPLGPVTITSSDLGADPTNPSAYLASLARKSWARRIQALRSQARWILGFVCLVPHAVISLLLLVPLLNHWHAGEAATDEKVIALFYSAFLLPVALPIFWLAIAIGAAPILRRGRRRLFRDLVQDQAQLFSSAAARIARDEAEIDQLGEFILYLRPFSFDTRMRVEGDYLETMIALSVADRSVLLCVGNGGDYPGAIEISPSDPEWQSYVMRLGTAASKILLVPGNTPGIIWEMQMLRKANLLNRVVFLMLPSALAGAHSDMATNWQRFRGHPALSEWEVPSYSRHGGMFQLSNEARLVDWGPLPTGILRQGLTAPLG